MQIENRSTGHQNSLQASSVYNNNNAGSIVTTTKDHHQQSIILQQALTNISTTSSITHSNYNGGTNSANNNVCNNNRIITQHSSENGQGKIERETVMVIGTTKNSAPNEHQYRMPIQSTNINSFNDRLAVNSVHEHSNQNTDYMERHKITDIRNLEIVNSRPTHIMSESKVITKQVNYIFSYFLLLIISLFQ